MKISGKILDFIWICALPAAAVGCAVMLPFYLLLKFFKAAGLFFSKKFRRGEP